MKSFVRVIAVPLLMLIGTAAGAAQPDETRFKAPGSPADINVAFVVTDSANVMDLAGPWEVFQDAGFNVFVVSESLAPLDMTGGLTVVPRYTFDSAPRANVVVVGAQLGKTKKMLGWLKARSEDQNTDALMSVCTGAFKLGLAGVLDGKRATTHHEFFDKFEKEFPNTTLVKESRYVQASPHLFTAGGLTSGIDLALHVVALYYGKKASDDVAAYMEYRPQGTERVK